MSLPIRKNNTDSNDCTFILVGFSLFIDSVLTCLRSLTPVYKIASNGWTALAVMGLENVTIVPRKGNYNHIFDCPDQSGYSAAFVCDKGRVGPKRNS